MRCGQHAEMEGGQTDSLLIEMIKAQWWYTDREKGKGDQDREKMESNILFS